jgi:uncharacterized protein YhjY with autotransporter beta-barrel domain/phospholipase/lecithinase/hemolysin
LKLGNAKNLLRLGEFVMRHPRSRARARSIACAAVLAAATSAFAPGASAQQHFDHLFVFGDSYADLTLSDRPDLKTPLAPAGLGLSLWRVYPLPLAENLGMKDSQIVDYAVGGARASPVGSAAAPPFLELPQQVGAFLSTKTPLGPNDLVTLNIGGNDIRSIFGNTLTNNPAGNATLGYPNKLITKDNAKEFADATTSFVMNGAITPLVNAGAHNFVLGGFSAFSGLPEFQAALPLLPSDQAREAAKAAVDKYAELYFADMQNALRPLALAGDRFFLFDLGRLGQQVLTDPRYGFTYTSFDSKGTPTGSQCPPIPSATICGGSLKMQDDNPIKYYFGPDGLHLTDAGFDLVGRYMANIVEAPSTIGVQPDVVSATTSGFVQSMLGRLDATRVAREAAGAAGSAGDGPMGLGRQDKSRAPQGDPSASRLTAYTMGTILGGDHGESSALVGYDYDARSGTVGIEYSVSRNLIFGIAGNYTTTNADLNNGAGIDVNAMQGAAYLSYATRHAYAEALAAYASHDVDLNRPGILDPVHSSTDAASVAAAVRGGYLFDVGALRAGPIAGLTYLHTRVDGYEESGDPLLTFKVSSQTLDSVAFNLGLRFLAPFQAGGSTVVPYLNVLLEQQFGDPTRTLTASLSQAPLLPILTPIASFEDSTYGRVEGGVTFQLGPALSATVNAATTFARDNERDFYVNAGLNYRF